MPKPASPATTPPCARSVTRNTAVAAAVRGLFGLPRVSLAETAVAVSGGRLLAPGWPGSAAQHEPTLSQ